MLSRLALMVQAAVLDGQFFDPVPPFDDGGVAAEVGVGGRDVAETLVVAVVVIVIDESADLAFKAPRQIIVFQQDAVLQRLMPALDLALFGHSRWDNRHHPHFHLVHAPPYQQSPRFDDLRPWNIPKLAHDFGIFP